MEVLNSCGTLRRVDNPDEFLRDTRDKECANRLPQGGPGTAEPE